MLPYPEQTPIAEWKRHDYPLGQRASGAEGVVIVNMMIDLQSKPYEATVVESAGETGARDPQLQYTIAGGDRGCWMEVVGDPGTKFQRVQL
jgi:hypothetical protein